GPNGEPSELLAVKLKQIEDLPPEKRMDAYNQLAATSGLKLEELSSARYAVRQETKMLQDVASLQDLPEAEKAKAWPRLAKKYGQDPAALQPTFDAKMASLKARLPPGALVVTKEQSCAKEDVAAQVDALVKQGVPRSDAEMVVADERRKVFEGAN